MADENILSKKSNLKNRTILLVLIIILLLPFVILGCKYISYTSRDVVFMDYWRFINRLIPAVANNNVSWDIIWNSDYGQRSPLLQALVVFNIKYTNLNCLWEEYAAIFVIAITAIVLFFRFRKIMSISSSAAEMIKVSILFIPIILTLYNLNQWEILTIEFAFPFMLRILSYVVVFCLVDSCYFSENDDNSKRENIKFLGIGILSGLEIIMLSQLYFVGLIVAVTCMAIFAIIFHKSNRKQNITNFLYYIVPNILSIIIYFSGSGSQSMGSNFNLFIEKLFSGEVFLGILMMILGSVMPQSKIIELSTNQVVVLGMLGIVVIVVAVVLYFISGMYKKSFLPVALVAYGLVSICTITYGRITVFDAFYLTSSRYSVETTLIWTGVLLVFIFAAVNNKKPITKITPVAGIIAISIVIICSDAVEWQIAPVRGTIKDSCIAVLCYKQPGEFTDEDAALFQTEKVLLNDGAYLLRKGGLNVFSAQGSLADVKNAGHTKETLIKGYGIYDDSWCEQNCSFSISSGDDGIIKLTVYQPEIDLITNESLTISVNGNSQDYAFEDTITEIYINVEPNSMNTIECYCNYSIQNKGEDQRALSWLLSDINGM